MTAARRAASIVSMFHTVPKDTTMKTWIRRTLIAATGIALVAGGLAACGHRGFGDHGGRGMATMSAEDVAQWRGRFVERATRELQLDAAQQQRLTVLFDKMNEQRTALLAGSDPRSTMTALIAGEKFDRAKASALVAEKTGAVQLKSPEVIAAAADFFDTLSTEQQAKVREFLARRGHRGDGGRGHRG
jgi:Spy/CpxP family protein refolding chaperone